MKKRLLLPVAAIAFVGLMSSFATTAQAYPTKTSDCSGCHSGVNVPVTATLATTTGTNATYDFSATGADAVVVFDGATKLFTFTAASGQFTVPTGKTYTVQSVAGPSTGDGFGSTTVSPVAAVVDATAPVTTSDAKTTYVESAAIALTATDAGSGVAGTYYVLDGAAQATGTSVDVSTVGTHTVEFWSADVAGNVEARTTATFAVTAAAPVPTTDVYTVTTHVMRHNTRGHIATLTNKVTGATFTAVVGEHGAVVFSDVPAGTYRLSVATDHGTKTLRTIKVHASKCDSHGDDHGDSDDHHDSDNRTESRNFTKN